MSSPEHTEQATEPIQAPGAPSHLSPLTIPRSSGQQADAAQHEQSSPNVTLSYQHCEDLHLVSPLRKRERSISSSSHGSWEDPLLRRPPEKRSRTISLLSHQPWEDPLLSTPPRTHYRSASTSSSSRNTSGQESSNTAEGPSDDRDKDMAVGAAFCLNSHYYPLM